MKAQTSKKGAVPQSDYLSNFTPKSPQQAALGSFGNVPINYYTSLPEVSFDLFTLTSRDLSLPIGINYDATGVHLEDFSGPVGLKFNLDAGGYIQRSINGIIDEDPNLGYFKWRDDLNAPSIDFVGWTPLSEKNTRDCEPDEFVLYFGGRSIKFFLDNGVGYSVPKQGVSITYVLTNNKISQFTVITEDGTKYVFGGTTNSTEERKVDNLSLTFYYYFVQDDKTGFYTSAQEMGGVVGSEKLGTSYNSKWYLVSINSPTGDYINFDYTRLGTNVQYVTKPNLTSRSPATTNRYYKLSKTDSVLVLALAAYKWSTSGGNMMVEASPNSFDPTQVPVRPDGLFINQSFITESVIKLNSITTSLGTGVFFESSTNRTDLPNALKYDRIYMATSSGATPVRDIRLNYNAVQSDLAISGGYWLTELGPSLALHDPMSSAVNTLLTKYSGEANKDYNYTRLYLENIQQVVGGTAKQLYSFGYDDRTFLYRRTAYFQSGLGVPIGIYTTDLYHPGPSIRDIQVFPTKGKLNQIVYATGGKTEFTYSQDFGQLASMIDRDENNVIVNQKELVSPLDYSPGLYPILDPTKQYNLMSNSSNYSVLNLFSTGIMSRSFSLTHGVVYANKNMRVYNGTSTNHNGYEDFVFTTDNDVATPIYASPPDSDMTSTYLTSVFPFPKNQDRDFLRGRLSEHTVYDKTGQPVMNEKVTYIINNSDQLPEFQYQPYTILGFVGGRYRLNDSNPEKTRYARYKVSADWITRKTTTTKVYDLGLPRDLNKAITTVNVEDYSLDGLVTHTGTYNQLTPTSRVDVTNFYVNDVNYYSAPNGPGAVASAEAQVLLDLQSKHQINALIEKQTTSTEGTVELGSTLVYKYKYVSTSPSFIKPYQILGLNRANLKPAYYKHSKIDSNTGQLVTEPTLRVLHNLDSYDSYGNILQQTSLDGTVTKYAWNSYNQVWDYIQNPGTFQHEIQYAYFPLVGLSSTKDANAIMTTYAYDGSNRLITSKDPSGNILGRYRYHLKGEAEPLTASISTSGSYITGNSILFNTPVQNRDYGDIHYDWDFGDGQTSSLAYSGGVNHTYTTAGTFTVTLKVSHPEYGTATATLQIKVIAPLTVSVCAKGPTRIEICNGGSQYVAASGSCGTATSTTLIATPVGGCGTLTYAWQVQSTTGGSWTTFGTTATVNAPAAFTNKTYGTYNVRCIVYDSCGVPITSSTITLYILNLC